MLVCQEKKGEEWRTFFLRLAELRHTNHPWAAAKSAAQLERLFEGIGESDISEIANNLDDLPKAISLLFSEREHDVVMHVMVKSDDGEVNDSNIIEFIQYLRVVKNIDDPELDVFWVAASGDLKLLESARGKGANLNIKSGVLINRYREHVPDFINSLQSQ